jgi:ubiquinone/menaquinone biosynthesis C-methylase UbiE
LAVARRNVDAAGLAARIELQLVDAKRLPHADGAFAWVMSNSIIHHIPEPRAVVAEALRVAALGAVVFFRDLMRPRDEATLRRLVEQYAGGANEHQQKMFSDSLHAALSLEEMQTLVAEYGCDPNEVHGTSDRHWTWAMRRSS